MVTNRREHESNALGRLWDKREEAAPVGSVGEESVVTQVNMTSEQTHECICWRTANVAAGVSLVVIFVEAEEERGLRS